MAFLRSPTQQPTYGTTSTSNAALEAMKRAGTVAPTMANAPAPVAPQPTPAAGIFGAPQPNNATPSTAARLLPGANAKTAVGAPPVGPTGVRIAPSQQTPDVAPAATGPTPGAGPDANPRPDLVTATTVDMQPSVDLFNKMLAENEAAWGKQQESLGQIYSANNRRNASNAALAGFSVGGGSYLGGQRQAAASSAGAFNNAWLANNQQRHGIFGQYANALGGAAGQNAQLAQGANIFNAGREGDIANQKTEAQSTQNANQNIASVDQVSRDFDYLFNDNNFKDGAGQYNSLFTAYKNSLSTGNPQEQAAAYQALMNYITPIQHAREEWLRTGGKDKNGSFQDWYKKQGGR